MQLRSPYLRRHAGSLVLTTFGLAACASANDGSAIGGVADDAGADGAPSVSSGSDGGDLASDAATPGTCDGALDREGCPCTMGSAPRSCYSGPAAQAGVGSCAMGQQACVGEGEFGKWGPCTGSGAPKTCKDAGADCGAVADGCGGTLSCGSCSGGQTCGGGGVANQCGATASSTCPGLVTGGSACRTCDATSCCSQWAAFNASADALAFVNCVWATACTSLTSFFPGTCPPGPVCNGTTTGSQERMNCCFAQHPTGQPLYTALQNCELSHCSAYCGASGDTWL